MLSTAQSGFNSRSTLRALLQQATRSSDCQNLVGHDRKSFNSYTRLSMIFPQAHWSETDRIEATIKDGRYDTWGFPIYRCSSYARGEHDDVRWKQFMTKIDIWAKEDLSDFVIKRFERTVHEDPSFEGASKEFVRSHRRKLSKPGNQHFQIPHHEFCLYVDENVVTDTLETGDSFIYDKKSNPSTLALIDVTFEMPDPETYDYVDAGFDPEVDDLPDPRDEGEDEVEGCKMYDVGWMRVPTGEAVGARLWNVLHHGGWIHTYRRPPEICRP